MEALEPAAGAVGVVGLLALLVRLLWRSDDRWERLVDQYATDVDTARAESERLRAHLAAARAEADGWRTKYLAAAGRVLNRPRLLGRSAMNPRTITRTEPAVAYGAATSVTVSLLALVARFAGVDLDPADVTAAAVLVAAVGPLVAGFLTRRKVASPDTVAAILAEAEAAGADADRLRAIAAGRPPAR